MLSLLFRKREREKERERKRKRERIKQLRKKKNISQSELASLIGVKKNTVSTWKRGTRKTDFNALQLLSDYFEVSFECLLTHVDD
ncbi:MAG: helix-turn-helix domain-containing protein [Spirochaetales bacterium]|nr:helix-turn-helix domain-containing protein [Spirochaetales bacterium]